MKTVFGIAVMAPNQKLAAETHCFGDCGKISMSGAINDRLTGGLLVCCEKVCPYMADEIENYGNTMSFDEHHSVTLRLLKLQPTPPESKG